MKERKNFRTFAVWLLCFVMILTTVNLPALSMSVMAAENEVTFEAIEANPAGNEGEGFENLLDGDPKTKWCGDREGAYVVIKASKPISVSKYTITTAADTSDYTGRNPRNWTFEACNDYDVEKKTGSWVTLDTVEKADLPTGNCESKSFDVHTADSYQYYKWSITSVIYSSFQVGEFFLEFCEHKFEKKGEKIEPSCWECGYDIEVCSECNVSRKVANEQPAKGHQFVDGVCSVCQFTNTPSVKNYATVDDLTNPDVFTLYKGYGDGIAQKVYFGGEKTWYIAGSQHICDKENCDDSPNVLVLMGDPEKDMTFGKYIFSDYNDLDKKIYDNKAVYLSHYGASDVKNYLTGEAMKVFSDAEQSMMVETPVWTKDMCNKCNYKTSDKLYLAHGNNNGRSPSVTEITVGTNSESDLDAGIKIAISGENKVSGSPYSSGSIFWLRTPHEKTEEQTEDGVNVVSGSGTGWATLNESTGSYFVVPAMSMDISSISFASAAEAGTADATFKDALTFRLKDSEKVLSSAIYDNDGLKVTKGGDDEYIYVQYKDENEEKIWSKAITEDMSIYKDCVGVYDFSQCKIWIEKKDASENLTYAKIAEKGETGITDHIWDDGAVTTPATYKTKGIFTYKCKVDGCTKTKTKELDKLPEPKKPDPGKKQNPEKPDPEKPDPEKPDPDKKTVKVGDKLKDKAKSTYIVTNVKKKEVAFSKPANKKVKSVNVPATIKVDGVSYKVVKVADKAFAGCKKLTKVTIGKNVIKIDANAFSGCKKLKTLTIKNTKLKAKNLNKKAFRGLTKKTTIKVAKAKVKSYKKMFKKKGLSNKVAVKAY